MAIASLLARQLISPISPFSLKAFGYATEEFEITADRLGCYLPTEHIDNPKGYGGNEDPRTYHPGLRPPIDPRELEIDPSTGMKNYIANERGNWDTSTALIKRTIEKCIHHGRMHRAQGTLASAHSPMTASARSSSLASRSGRTEDEYEAYRLLGQALHTLEDFSAVRTRPSKAHFDLC